MTERVDGQHDKVRVQVRRKTSTGAGQKRYAQQDRTNVWAQVGKIREHVRTNVGSRTEKQYGSRAEK